MADITNPESLKGALRWKEVIEESADLIGGKAIPVILLQNKFDLLSEDDPKEDYQTMENLETFAKKNNFKACFQVSAKLDKDLDRSIEALLEEILKLNLVAASRDNFFRSERHSDSYRLSKHSVLGNDRKTILGGSKIDEKKNNCAC